MRNAYGPDGSGVEFLNVDTGKTRATIKVPLAAASDSLAISGDGKLAVAAQGGKLVVYDAVKKTVRVVLPTGAGSTVALVDSNRRVVTGGASVVALDTGKVEKPFVLPPEKGEKLPKAGGAFTATWVRPTPDSAYLLTVGVDRVARVWTLPFGEKK